MIVRNNILHGGSANLWRKLPVLPLDEVLPHIRAATQDERKPQHEFGGDTVKMSSVRLRCFKEGGVTCCFCGVEATHFAKERHAPTERWHLNLYGYDADGVEVLFTKDHVLPKSRGGSDRLDNMQTACSPCNGEKGNHIEG